MTPTMEEFRRTIFTARRTPHAARRTPHAARRTSHDSRAFDYQTHGRTCPPSATGLWKYRAIYLEGRQPFGQWSDTGSIAVTG